MNKLSVDQELELLLRGVAEIISAEDLKNKLEQSRKEKRPLRIKAGFDPSAPDIHLGHTVLLRKLRHFQECGHEVIVLIGDFTGRIGDPTGKSALRKQLTPEEVQANAKTYTEQIFKVLDAGKTKVVFNSEWCDKMSFADVIELSSKYTVARMLERDDFAKRYAENKPISVLEFLYPLVQGYDSVVLKSDVELGGTDQKFNLLVGRQLQKEYGQQEQQVVLMMPILEGLDGVQKMSKSLDNYVGINEDPQNMFGKIMSVSDKLMFRYYELLTDLPLKDIEGLKQEIYREMAHPKQVKMELAKQIVSFYYNQDVAEECALEFDKIFKEKGTPTNLEEHVVTTEKIWIVQLLLESGLCATKSEARRMIQQGAVRLDDCKVEDPDWEATLSGAHILQMGKRGFRQIVLNIE